jgi:hypothetical protein
MDDFPEMAYELLEEAELLGQCQCNQPLADDAAQTLEEVLKDPFASLEAIETALGKAVVQLGGEEDNSGRPDPDEQRYERWDRLRQSLVTCKSVSRLCAVPASLVPQPEGEVAMYKAINAFGNLVQQVQLSFDDRFVPVKGAAPAAFVLEITIQDGEVSLRQTSGEGLVFYVETHSSEVQDGLVSIEEWIKIDEPIALPFLHSSRLVEVFLPGSSEILGFESAFRKGIGSIISLYRKITSEIPNSAGLGRRDDD